MNQNQVLFLVLIKKNGYTDRLETISMSMKPIK